VTGVRGGTYCGVTGGCTARRSTGIGWALMSRLKLNPPDGGVTVRGGLTVRGWETGGGSVRACGGGAACTGGGAPERPPLPRC